MSAMSRSLFQDANVREEMFSLRRQGKKNEELAARYGVHEFTIAVWCKKYGVRVEKKDGTRAYDRVLNTPEKIEEMLEYRRNGWSLQELGRKYGLDHGTIANHCRKHGLTGIFKIVDPRRKELRSAFELPGNPAYSRPTVEELASAAPAPPEPKYASLVFDSQWVYVFENH